MCAADHAAPGRADRRGRHPRGRGQRHHRPGRDRGRSHRHPPRRRQDRLHRRHLDRQAHHEARRRHREAGRTRAGRQQRLHRARGRRRRRRGRGRHLRQLLQHRPGVRGLQPPLRARVAVRPVLREAGRGGQARCAWAIPWTRCTVIGPVPFASHRDKIESYVASAKAAGAKVLLEGGRPDTTRRSADGYFVLPTIFGDADNRWSSCSTRSSVRWSASSKFSDQRRGRGSGQRHQVRTVGVGLDQGPAQRPGAGAPARSRHRLAQRAPDPLLRHARGAAARSRASARTSAPWCSRSTCTPSTSTST